MLTRTKRVTLAFQHPFSLKGGDRRLATLNNNIKLEKLAMKYRAGIEITIAARPICNSAEWLSSRSKSN
jgi:hypothetical protein